MSKSLFLLLMLSVCNEEPIRGKTKLVKIMYIAGRELKKLKISVDFYKFYRHYYGPFADELISDLENLIQRNLVDHFVRENITNRGIYEENFYRITPEGIIALEANSEEITFFQEISNVFMKVKRKYNRVPLSMLIQEVYRKYPLSTQ